MISEEKVLEVEELASKLKIGRDAAYELVKQPGFPSVRIGKRIIIPVVALDKWLLEEAFKEK